MPLRKLHNVDLSARYNPKDSWWIRPREGFTAHCEREWSRMRSSYYGLRSLVTGEGRAPSSLDIYRAKKKLLEAR